MDNAQSAKEGAQEAAPEIRTTLLSGVAAGVEGLKSLVFFLAFAMLSTLFVLKDGPVMHRFINRHMGVPNRVAAQLLPRRDDHRRVQRHPDRGRGADSRRSSS